MPTPYLTYTPSVGVFAPPPTDTRAPLERADDRIFNALATFDAPLHPRHVRALVRDRILPDNPRFRQLPDDAEPADARPWRDAPAFDLDLHVHRRALGAPGDHRALRELVATVTRPPLDARRPPWDIICVDGSRAGGALVIRLDRRLVADPRAFVDKLAEQLGGCRGAAETCPGVGQHGHRRG